MGKERRRILLTELAKVTINIGGIRLARFYAFFPCGTLDTHPDSNPIESTFATVRLRTVTSRDSGSRETTLAMVFKLVHPVGGKELEAHQGIFSHR